MKVLYNACHGGFDLSMQATNEYTKTKYGIDLTWYTQTKYNHRDGCTEYQRVDNYEDDEISLFRHASKEDLGKKIEEIPSQKYYYLDITDELRTDPVLIEIVERLGSDANGECASIKIAEIPDGVEWEIDEYDGIESIVPPRQVW